MNSLPSRNRAYATRRAGHCEAAQTPRDRPRSRLRDRVWRCSEPMSLFAWRILRRDMCLFSGRTTVPAQKVRSAFLFVMANPLARPDVFDLKCG